MIDLDNFAVFILTNGRPKKVYTYKLLRSSGYTGKIYLLIDDLDKCKDEYLSLYGSEEVIIFDKKEIAKTFDQADNFNDMRAIIYARNASFEVAKNLNIKYFLQLDDDYTSFGYRFDNNYNYKYSGCKNLDEVIKVFLEFYKNTNVSSIAFAQGGDFIGGSESDFAQNVQFKRKCMNSFFCSTDRPFKFIGRINEDVNTYTRQASIGAIFFTSNFFSLTQKTTQKNSGGMTELYLDSGTYVKSFYTIMFQPSSVKIGIMSGGAGKRLHHSIDWEKTVPKILRESCKKV